MKTIKTFMDLDRYYYDFGMCSTKNGFAQVDTSQDASYYGTWANPEKLVIVSYCEGDVTIQTAKTIEEFVSGLYTVVNWNRDNGHHFYGIDPGLNESLAKRFQSIGLNDLLHSRYREEKNNEKNTGVPETAH